MAAVVGPRPRGYCSVAQVGRFRSSRRGSTRRLGDDSLVVRNQVQELVLHVHRQERGVTACQSLGETHRCSPATGAAGSRRSGPILAAIAMLRAGSPGCQGTVSRADSCSDLELIRPRAGVLPCTCVRVRIRFERCTWLVCGVSCRRLVEEPRGGSVKPGKSGVAEKPRLLVIDRDSSHEKSSLDCLSESFDRVTVRTVSKALALLRDQKFDGVFVDASQLAAVRWVGMMMQAEEILDAISDGVAVVDPDLRIIWANPEFQSLAGSSEAAVGALVLRGARQGRDPGPGPVSVHHGRWPPRRRRAPR